MIACRVSISRLFATISMTLISIGGQSCTVSMKNNLGALSSATSSSTLGTYLLDSISPASPSTNQTPTIRAHASLEMSTVTLYSDSACVTSLYSGTESSLEAGVAVTMSNNAITTVYAQGRRPDGTLGTGCVYLTTYDHDLTPPSISIGSPSSSLVLRTTGTITFSVTYSGASSVNLTSGDISLNTTGGSSCAVAVSNGTTATPTVTLSACTLSGTVGISIAAGTATDVAGNSALASGPSAVVQVVTAPTLALSDGTTGWSTYVRQAATATTIGNDASSAKWCLSETQTTPPASGSSSCSGGAGPSNGWFLSRPTSVNVSGGDGSKTIYLWIADASDGVLDATVTATIILDSTPPIAPTVSLIDPNTSSTTNTNHAANTISITTDTGAVQWCVIEQSSAAAPPGAPLFDDACFVGTRPTSISLSSRGVRKAYVYTEDVAGNVSATPGTATLDFPLPTVLTLSGPDHIPQSGCSDPITVTAKDVYGLESPVTTNNAITLTGEGAGAFYSDAGCTTAITETFSTGDSTKKIYFKSGTTGALTLTGTGFSTSGTLPTSVDPVYQISVGDDLTCAVVAGSAECWGNGDTGALGVGGSSYQSSSVARQVSGFTSGVSMISAGGEGACAVKDGAAYCWGNGWTGQLGSALGSSTTPALVTGLGFGVRSIAKQNGTVCAIVGEIVKCWGANSKGELGNGTTGGSSNTPVTVSGITSGATRVVVGGGGHVCAIVDGGVNCWGNNNHGQLGNNSTSSSDVPVSVTGLASGVTALTAGQNHSCAIKNGALYCWGDNSALQVGQVGGGDVLVPTLVSGLTSGVTAVTGGYESTCAVISAGVKCWGSGRRLELGFGTYDNHTASPADAAGLTSNVRDISADRSHSICATLTTNEFRCWGGNARGQVGNAAASLVLYPQPVAGLGASVSRIVSGYATNCALLTDGRIQCWGEGADVGLLGNGLWKDSSVPVYVSGIGSGATHLAIGYSTACAVVSGSAQCWGAMVGDGTYNYYGSPVEASGLSSGVTRVAVSTRWSTTNCAVVNGGVQCWGDNTKGQVGVSGGGYIASPVDVTNLPAASGATEIAVGAAHACALVGGAVKCWGDNSAGQLGDGTNTSSYTPVTAIPAGATALSASAYYSCAVVAGAAKCWGGNYSNQLGTNDWTDYNTPQTVIGLSSGVSGISTYDNTACALLSTGTIKCWGFGHYGEIGNGGTGNVYGIPTTVRTITSGATEVSAGYFNTCAVVGGGAYCWGDDRWGLLGDQPTLFDSTAYSPILVGSPAKLTVSGPSNSVASSCSTAFTVTLKTAEDVVTPTSSGITINLSGGGTGAFYDSAGCGGAAVTSVSMGPGASTATFYYMAPSAQEVGIVVSSPNLVRDSALHNAN